MAGPDGRAVTVPVCAASVEKKVYVIFTTMTWDFTDPSGAVENLVVTVPPSCSNTGKPQLALVWARKVVSSTVSVTKVGVVAPAGISPTSVMPSAAVDVARTVAALDRMTVLKSERMACMEHLWKE